MMGLSYKVDAKHLAIECHMVIAYDVTIEFFHDGHAANSNGGRYKCLRSHIRWRVIPCLAMRGSIGNS